VDEWSQRVRDAHADASRLGFVETAGLDVYVAG